jgi:osmotically-inducible protein OsmY
MKSDLQLERDVIAELEGEPTLRAAALSVTARGGVLTLGGRVESYAQKWAAERAVRRVPGVGTLVVELSVTPPGPNPRSDSDIARAAQNVLLWLAALPPEAVQARVEQRRITLVGEVDWDYQRQAATEAVQDLLGVVGVSNQIALRPRAALRAVAIPSGTRRRAGDASQPPSNSA